MNPVVHLELHTGDLSGARSTYAQLCNWDSEEVQTGRGDYTALALGEQVAGGIVQCPVQRAMWLPYVRVGEIRAATARAVELGATVLLGPREGPAGWRAVISTRAGGEIAFWQPKVWRS
jgi:predicted enzyme related to lactoylglutathione lyase